MSEISMKKLRANLSDILSKAEFGGEVTIVTRHRKESAAIIPVSMLKKWKKIEEAFEDQQDLQDALDVKLEIEKGTEKTVEWDSLKDAL